MKDKLSFLKKKFLELRNQRDEGKLADTEFLSQVQAMAVEDEAAAGCWWNINPENGRWIYYDGKSWVERTPQGFGPSVVPPEAKKPRPPAPVTAAKPAKAGRPWLWATIIVVGVAVIAGGIWGIWLLTQQPSYTGGGDDDDRDPVRDLLSNFYGTYSRGDYDGLNKFLEIKRPAPAALSGPDLERQKTTIANITTLGEFVGQYIMDFR